MILMARWILVVSKAGVQVMDVGAIGSMGSEATGRRFGDTVRPCRVPNRRCFAGKQLMHQLH